MFLKDQLTTEVLRGLAKNNFELANYAIKLGKYLILSGHEVTLGDLLEQVRKHPSEAYLDELKMLDKADQQEQRHE